LGVRRDMASQARDRLGSMNKLCQLWFR
jgi:hypothetical protein